MRDHENRQHTISIGDQLIAAVRESVHAVQPISQVPVVILAKWCLLRHPSGSLHLVGWNVSENEGRTSTAVVSYDRKFRRARTASGRVYVLDGPPGWDSDGIYVAERWLEAQGVAFEESMLLPAEKCPEAIEALAACSTTVMGSAPQAHDNERNR